jgi:CTP synthase (UTP-ammonia lyase)
MDGMIPIALVGDRSPTVRAHTRIPTIIDALRESEGLDLDVYWVPTPAAEDPAALHGFAGIWLVPGSPYRSEAGGIAAARTARVEGIPFLGTCGGFQHAMLEFARDVCGLTTARHVENESGTPGDELIVPLSCSLAGHEAAIELTPGSLVERLLGRSRTVERYHCSYGLSPIHLELLRAHGMRFTGHDDAGEVRVAELPGHPFYLATLFQPELSGEAPHPLIRGFAQAADRTARPRQSTPTR